MAKKQYTGTKVGITAAMAGLTVLTANWLAPSGGGEPGGVTLATADTVYETTAAEATATPTISSGTTTRTSASSNSSAATTQPTATPAVATTSSSTSKTSRGS